MPVAVQYDSGYKDTGPTWLPGTASITRLTTSDILPLWINQTDHLMKPFKRNGMDSWRHLFSILGEHQKPQGVHGMSL
jgi:hypothetical protein